MNQSVDTLLSLAQELIDHRGTLQQAIPKLAKLISTCFSFIFSAQQLQDLSIYKACQNNINQVLQNLQTYFNSHPIPIQSIMRNKPYVDEGFLSSEDEQEKKQCMFRSTVVPKKVGTTQLTQSTIEGNQDLIAQIRNRDQIIQNMTVGYLKDIAHFREMVVRKDLFPEDEMFDVSYYDLTKSLDPSVKEFIRGKIIDVTTKFNMQIHKLQQLIYTQGKELEHLKQTISVMIGSNDVHSMLKAMLAFEKDTYRIWRGIQDIIGTHQIFEVFEKRRAGYGIDYAQVDQMIAQSQAAHRIFSQYKDTIDQQYVTFTSSVRNEVKLLQDQKSALQNEIHDLKNQKVTNLIQIRQAIKLNAENISDIKEQKLKDKYTIQLQEITGKDSMTLLKHCLRSLTMHKWLYLARFKTLQQTSRRRSNSLDFNKNNKDALILNKYIKLQREFMLEQQKVYDIDFQCSNIKSELDLLSQKYQTLQYNYDMQIKKYHYLEQNAQYMENIVNYFEKLYQLILKKIGYGNLGGTLKYNKFNFELADAQLKQFAESIRKVEVDDFDHIKEAAMQLIKKQIAYQKMIGCKTEDASTITYVYDIRQPLKDTQQTIELESEPEQQKPEQSQPIEQQPEQQQPLETIVLQDSAEQSIVNPLLDDEIIENIEIQQDNTIVHQDNVLQLTKMKLSIDMVNSNNIETGHPITTGNPRYDTFEFYQNTRTISKNNQITYKQASIQTDMHFDCNVNNDHVLRRQVKDIYINELEEFKKHIKGNIKTTPRRPDYSKRPGTQQTFATLISQMNVNKMQQQSKSTRNNTNTYYIKNTFDDSKCRTETKESCRSKSNYQTYFRSARAQIIVSNLEMGSRFRSSPKQN